LNRTARHRRAGRTREFLTGGFLLLALMVAMTAIFAARTRTDGANAQQAGTAAERLVDVLSTMRQAESGLRGYLLTGNPVSTQTYNMALAALPAELHALDATLANGPDQTDLAAIHALAASKLTQLAQAKTLYDSGNKQAAAALVNADLDIGTMQSLRSLIGQLQAEQVAKLAASEADDERNGWILQIATGIAALGTLLLGSFAIRDSRARNLQLRSAEAALTRANEALERKVAERTRTLITSEMQFRSLAESMPGFVFMNDAKGRNIYINQQFCDYTGLTEEQVRLSGGAEYLHPDDSAPTLAVWAHSLATGTPFEMEYRFRRADGTYRWFIGRTRPVHGEDGAVTGWIGTGTDINERKRAEAEIIDANTMLEDQIAERSRELDRIFRLSTDLLAVADFSGRFLSVSPAWEQITGRKTAEALASTYTDFLHPDHLQDAAADFEELRQGHSIFCENRYRRADGAYRWLSWRAVPMVEEARIYAVARDITAEKEREEQLRQSQKMEVVGQLTGGIAHDFNNLLTIIMGSLELLQRGLPDPDARTQRRIDSAMEGTRRAAALTHRLLAFARRQPLEPKPIEPNRLLAGMQDMFSRVVGETIALEFAAAPGLWPVRADVNQLENSILNLVVNARDAMPEGGHLTIETQNTVLDESYTAAHPDVEPGQYAMIAVTDTGTGMTPEIRAKVFEPFFTTKPQGSGTGLGLAQVYGFIKQSSGHVAIYSEPGHGTSIKLFLPRLRGADADVEAPAPSTPAQVLPSRGETILVVEDEDSVRNFSVEVLQDSGYQVLAAENATRALELLDATPGIAMLFTDVVLSGAMNGRALATAVLARHPATAILFTTGYTRNAIIHHGRLDDGIDFLGKPFTAAALTQTVRQILDRQPPAR
jgi:PAS domain S-box-containing protein